VTETDYDWRHGWVPLTMRAALQKTKGNREAAAELLGQARAERASRRHEFTSPHPIHRAEHAERKRWARYSDDDLADELGAAADEDDVTRIVAELDRRDRAEAKAAARADRARERRAARRTAEEAQRSRDFDAACDAGDDPETAYARIYGVTEEKIRRDQAEEHLRAGGYSGKTFRDRVKAAHTDTVHESFLHAESVCRGHLLSAAGERAGVSPASLWSGPAATAKKYASEELLDYFRQHGRLTLDDFTAELLGGHAKFRTTGDDW
jgi:hypothetical protein